jgi:hypothetical protein
MCGGRGKDQLTRAMLVVGAAAFANAQPQVSKGVLRQKVRHGIVSAAQRPHPDRAQFK